MVTVVVVAVVVAVVATVMTGAIVGMSACTAGTLVRSTSVRGRVGVGIGVRVNT